MLEEQGKGIISGVLRFFLKHLLNVGSGLEQLGLKKASKSFNSGKMPVKKFIKKGGQPEFTIGMEMETAVSVGKELKKQGLKFSVVPNVDKDEDGNEKNNFKIMYDVKYSKYVDGLVDKYVKKELNPKKESLESRLKRAKDIIAKTADKQLSRSEPLKHKEVGAR